MTWIPATEEDRKEMLAAVGASSMEDLFASVPPDLRMKSWDLPRGMSEFAVCGMMARIGAHNNVCATSFLGGGYYDHAIPAAVDALAGRSEFYTAYTPYQPECSQGTLQAIYEYQSAVCRLTGLEFANASLYDGGTALFEATTMAVRATRRNKVVVHPNLNPRYREMLDTHAANLDLELAAGDDPEGAACVLVQNPDFFGNIHDFTELGARCQEAGALLVLSFYPVAQALLKTPGEMGAAIAVAEGQSLGIPLGFGGPYLGIMATRKKYVRKMPGRVAGMTEDAEGNRGFVLTLQTREQHIRRGKAMSNICSNQALCALRAIIHLSLFGKQGMREVAVQCHAKAEYLKQRIGEFAPVLNSGPTFNEFVVRLPKDASRIAAGMRPRYHAGLPLSALDAGEAGDLLIAVTEKRTREELDAFAAALEEAACN